jgi:hypothetical protein
LLVAVELQVVARKALELEAACIGESLNGATTVAEQFVEVEIVGLELDMPGVGARQIEQIVHEAGEAAGFVENDAERFAVFGGAA